jgi:hypothetical protein
MEKKKSNGDTIASDSMLAGCSGGEWREGILKY